MQALKVELSNNLGRQYKQLNTELCTELHATVAPYIFEAASAAVFAHAGTNHILHGLICECRASSGNQ